MLILLVFCNLILTQFGSLRIAHILSVAISRWGRVENVREALRRHDRRVREVRGERVRARGVGSIPQPLLRFGRKSRRRQEPKFMPTCIPLA